MRDGVPPIAGWRKFVGPILVIFALAFLPVLFVPLVSTRVPIISYNEIALARIAYDLFFIDKFLFFIVFVFGIIFPIGKTSCAVLCWYWADGAGAERCHRVLVILGKLSMLDIMLLAIFIVAFKGIGVGTVQVRYGLYLYTLLVLLSYLLTLFLKRALGDRV